MPSPSGKSKSAARSSCLCGANTVLFRMAIFETKTPVQREDLTGHGWEGPTICRAKEPIAGAHGTISNVQLELEAQYLRGQSPGRGVRFPRSGVLSKEMSWRSASHASGAGGVAKAAF